MRSSTTTTTPTSMLARAGTAAFLFFLVKGALWLALPAWLYFVR